MQNHTSGPAGIRLGNCVYVGGYFYGGIIIIISFTVAPYLQFKKLVFFYLITT